MKKIGIKQIAKPNIETHALFADVEKSKRSGKIPLSPIFPEPINLPSYINLNYVERTFKSAFNVY